MEMRCRWSATVITGMLSMQKHIVRLMVPCSVLAVAIAGIQPVLGQDETDEEAIALEETGERCISTRQISRTKVVDDRTIIFYMRGGDTFVNILPRQ